MQEQQDLQNQLIEPQQTMQRSRLTKNLERQSRKNLFLSLIGIIILLFILVKFGIPLLVNFTLFISGSKDTKETKIEKRSFIPPPILNPLPQATGSAEIVISGFADPSQNIELYINDDLIDKTPVDDKGNFIFEEKISPGENVIKTKAISDNKESEFSNPVTITLRNKPPSLSIDSPTDGQSFAKEQKTLDVIGTTDSDVRVIVNGFRAIIDGNGRFIYRVTLSSGENIIKIIGEDEAGNKAEKELKVTYNP